jgi:hypothetical protein
VSTAFSICCGPKILSVDDDVLTPKVVKKSISILEFLSVFELQRKFYEKT